MEIFPTLCKKFLTLFKKFLTVWRYAKPGKQNKGNRENETTLNGDLRESQSVGKNEKSVKFFAATAVLHRKRAQKFVVRGFKEWWLSIWKLFQLFEQTEQKNLMKIVCGYGLSFTTMSLTIRDLLVSLHSNSTQQQ